MAIFALSAIAVAFIACVVAIAACDLSNLTIPNSISVALIFLFLASIPFARGDISLLSHLYSFLIVLGIGLIAFRFGMFGGGDIKSWAAIAVWYDLQALPVQVICVALIGGGVGIALLGIRYLVARPIVHVHWQYRRVPRLLRPGEPVPYGLAIAAGTLLSANKIDLFRWLPT
jgi:prepilin peptidase CpaA